MKKKFQLCLVSFIFCFFTSEALFAEYSKQVFSAQEYLTQRGYNPGPIDGYWGKRTENALRAFQIDNGLQPTGKLDQPTLDKLILPPNKPLKKHREFNFTRFDSLSVPIPTDFYEEYPLLSKNPRLGFIMANISSSAINTDILYNNALEFEIWDCCMNVMYNERINLENIEGFGEFYRKNIYKKSKFHIHKIKNDAINAFIKAQEKYKIEYLRYLKNKLPFASPKKLKKLHINAYSINSRDLEIDLSDKLTVAGCDLYGRCLFYGLDFSKTLLFEDVLSYGPRFNFSHVPLKDKVIIKNVDIRFMEHIFKGNESINYKTKLYVMPVFGLIGGHYNGLVQKFTILKHDIEFYERTKLDIWDRTKLIGILSMKNFRPREKYNDPYMYDVNFIKK